MRIIGGKYKGRRIVPPGNFKARPTTDFAREGLFNILNNRIDFESVIVLDLFSGTGSISYEFASRGAAEVHLVEKDKLHISGIRRIINEIGFENIKPIHIDVKAYLKTCSVKYDIVFADPPYDLKWLKELPDLVSEAGVIKEDGFFVLEHPRGLSFKDHILFFEHRNYGGVNFSFFKPLSA
ncbi:MAG: 16S rRNA (guanine(966)-N(2))-methyltransferase RsmD [Bacteroidetes bacterium GWE2_41_25]|nr:MAG: 16S rRNA (guanine(966)-N(2))-methyltransferase RsmD [Bacteroidetes bacterium GWA2_40_15]OFX93664.1 MAG: 16S rRNA (guanine(966)-N(2))-methyltransferase RsmD [Bacteroidetes bacterium GWC2_40_22]OFY01608.1 MAG: 16S rRNA (guanine(966)-N(2))-methyltransferase RsmD [Bacteroidetes bacterium GWE2_41_25]OFY61098.1 MAG: 16S rRNA (guanine(966)-N(2))-methyltransferase RsmD [Bacteroidetes bacterium GWF2_41_9]HAM08797.1 16S rRNA (guanine(966)-N(2))-methyltransferase RsmD [Bacteroidales bacterium]